jgi:hypothetical protein
MMRLEVAPDLDVAPNNTLISKACDAKTVLEELFVLLEDYGPAWYTEEHHNRALNALLEREN